MYQVMVAVKIDDDIRLLEYQSSTMVAATAITDLFFREDFCASTNIINKDDRTIMFKANIEAVKSCSNLARLFLVDYWIDGVNDKVWKIIPKVIMPAIEQ